MTGIARRFARLPFSAAAKVGVGKREDPSRPELSRTGLRHLAVRDYLAAREVPRGIRILDVGCGDAALARLLTDSGYTSIEGCDWLPESAVEWPSEGGAYRRVDLNAQGLEPFAEASFDVVLCSDVIEHLENPSAMLREIRRVLRPGGVAIVTLPNAFNLLERFCWLVRGNSTRYKPEQSTDEFGHISVIPSDVMKSLAARAGLNIVHVEGGYGFFDGYVVRKRLGTKLSYNIMWVLEKPGGSEEAAR